MKSLIKAFLRNSQQQYVDLIYRLRNFTKWKRINAVHLSINDGLISKSIFGNIIRGDYEIDENKILQETFTSEDVLLELGTGIGFNSIWCARINDNKVITFEGNPNMIPLITKNMKKNKTSFILKNEIVISKNFQTTSMPFNIVDEFWSSSAKSIGGNITKKVDVPTCDINAVVREFQPTYLVVDIEGGEEDLFEDCYWIKNSPIRKIMIELHADIIGEEKCFMVMQNLASIGFKLRFDGAPKNVVFFSK